MVWRHYKGHLVIFLVFAAIVTAMVVTANNAKPCPGHWHASQDVYVNGERMSYQHPKFTLEGRLGMPVSTHMHDGNDAMWHFEPQAGTQCSPFREALAFVDTDISPGKLVLDGVHEDLGQAGVFTDNGTSTLRAYHRVGGEDWQSISIPSLHGRQLQPDERVLIVYGNETDDQLAPFKAKADGNEIQSSSRITGPSYVAATGVGLIGLIVLGAWHALSKKAT